MTPIWRIRLCDGLTLEDASGREVHRFRSQKAAALLAYLALQQGRPCTREHLCDLLWPDENVEITRTRLRITLASLRRQLEPPGVPSGAVLESLGNNRLRLRSESITTDIAEIEAAMARGDAATARRLAQGELLPTFFDDWAVEARQWFVALRERLRSDETVIPPAPPSSPAVLVPSPSPPSARRFPQSLPVYLTRFFGRQAEQARLTELLAAPDVRLVTLVGGGGHGKTRLAVEAARTYTAGPVWFAALADLWDGSQLPFALLRALGQTAVPTREPLEQIAAFFAEWDRPLLVVDNLEQIVQRAAPIIASLLASAQNLAILATSRSHLELPGERTLSLAPLSPDGGEAAALFVDRAQSVLPDFQQTPRNAETIVAVCNLLDGIPLGIELAAARIGSLTVAKMQAQLETHWNALPATGRTSDGKEVRHRSLRAVIEWSVALLPPDQKRLFIGLAVFRGGATLEAIETICDAPFALDTLTRLRAASLVNAYEDGGDLRFTVLEVLRQWAAESLPPELAERHARYFAERASAPFPNDTAQVAWMSREYGNIQAALNTLGESRNVPLILALLGSLGTFWLRHGHLREARERFAALLPLAHDAPPGTHHFDTLANAAVIAQVVGELDEADDLWRRALPVAQTLKDGPRQARALATLGAIQDNRGDFAGSVALNQEALAIAQQCGDLRGQARALLFLIGDYANLKELARGEQMGREGIAIARQMGDEWFYAAFLLEYGSILLTQGNLTAARPALSDSLRTMDRLNDRSRVHYALEAIAFLNEQEGKPETAPILLSAAARIREAVGYPAPDIHRGHLDQLTGRLKETLGASRFGDAWRRGAQTPLPEIIALATGEDDSEQHPPG